MPEIIYDVFHTYPGGELISLSESYSLDRVIYQYVQNCDNIRNDIEEWMHQHSEECRKFRLLYVRKAPIKTCEALEKYVRDLELPEGYFPFTIDGMDCAVDYFRDEYGALEVVRYRTISVFINRLFWSKVLWTEQ